MRAMGREEFFRTVADILRAAKEPKPAESIMREAKLDAPTLERYLKVLLRRGLLVELEEEGRRVYKTSPKGAGWLGVCEEIERLPV